MPSKVLLSDPAIPFGSLVLVTGANGLLGSHIVDQLLLAGYNVRGAVRCLKRCAWLVPFFKDRYKSSDVNFEIVQVEDMSIDGCFDEAVKGCAGVIHSSSSVDLQVTKPEPTISETVKTAMACMRSAAREPSVQRYVLTSSAWAISSPRPNVEFVVSPKDWNEQAVKDAHAEGTPACNGISIYMAGKTVSEKECWKFVQEHKPGFVFNTVHPDTVMGKVLSPENQGIPSTARLVKMLFESQGLEMLKIFPPQYHCDSEDQARLHVGALVHPQVTSERLPGHADRWNLNDILEILRKLYPNMQFPSDLDDLGRDISTVEDERSRWLLKEVYGQDGWTSLEQSVKANVESFFSG